MSALARFLLVAGLLSATGCAGVLLRCGSLDLEVATPSADPAHGVKALALVLDATMVSDDHPAPIRVEDRYEIYSFTAPTNSDARHRMLLVTLVSGHTAAFVAPPGEPASTPFSGWFTPDFVTDDQYPATKLLRTGALNRISTEEPVHARYRFAPWEGCAP